MVYCNSIKFDLFLVRLYHLIVYNVINKELCWVIAGKEFHIMKILDKVMLLILLLFPAFGVGLKVRENIWKGNQNQRLLCLQRQ